MKNLWGLGSQRMWKNQNSSGRICIRNYWSIRRLKDIV
jgi:hypothetical protein